MVFDYLKCYVDIINLFKIVFEPTVLFPPPRRSLGGK